MLLLKSCASGQTQCQHAIVGDTSRNWNNFCKKRGFFDVAIGNYSIVIHKRWVGKKWKTNPHFLAEKIVAWFFNFLAYDEKKTLYKEPKPEAIFAVGGSVFFSELPRRCLQRVCSVRKPKRSVNNFLPSSKNCFIIHGTNATCTWGSIAVIVVQIPIGGSIE